MNDYERQRAREWLRAMRGALSQEALVEDINATLGDWAITRDRYSRYESGSVPFGRSVLAQFVRYWAAKGQPGPDFTPQPTPEPEPTLAAALVMLTQELAAMREERAALAARVESMAATLDRLVADALARQGSGEHSGPAAPPVTTA